MRARIPNCKFLIVNFLVALLLARVPASAQTDFAGEWQRVQEEDSALNPAVGDWFGIPMNDAARARAETWDAASWTLPESRRIGTAELKDGPLRVLPLKTFLRELSLGSVLR